MPEQSKTLFVAGLNPEVTKEEIVSRFQKFGHIPSVEVKSKQDGNGKILYKFAFITLAPTNVDSFQKCITTYNKSKWKGNILTVCPAKESQSGQTSAKESQSGQESSNKDQRFIAKTDAFHKLMKQTEKITKKSEASKADKMAVSSPAKPIVTSKEKQKSVKLSISQSEKPRKDKSLRSEASNQSTSKVNGQMKTDKKPKAGKKSETVVQKNKKEKKENGQNSLKGQDVVNNNLSEKVSSKLKVSTKLMGDFRIKDNVRRLTAIEEMKKFHQDKRMQMKKALSSVDKPQNKKVKFDDDDNESDSENGDGSSSSDEDEASTSGPVKGAAKLFDSDSDQLDDIPDKPHFEGKAGHKLMKLQSKLGLADDRFTIDQRFVDDQDSSTDGDQGDGEPNDEDDEKKKTLEILSQVLGHKVEPAKKKDVIPDMNKMRLTSVKDLPTIQQPTKKQRQATVSKPSAAPIQESVREVSQEKYVNISKDLKTALKQSGSSFSLLQTFGKVQDEEDEKDRGGNVCKFDFQSSVKSKIEVDNEDVDMKDEDAVMPKSETFTSFFVGLDHPLIQQGIKNFCQWKMPKEEADGWQEKKTSLLLGLKQKRKRALLEAEGNHRSDAKRRHIQKRPGFKHRR